VPDGKQWEQKEKERIEIVRFYGTDDKIY